MMARRAQEYAHALKAGLPSPMPATKHSSALPGGGQQESKQIQPVHLFREDPAEIVACSVGGESTHKNLGGLRHIDLPLYLFFKRST